MYRVALRMLGDRDAAEEVAQEASLRALAGASRFDSRASLATWLHRITVNCATDRLRDRAREPIDPAELLARAWRPQQTPDLAAEQAELVRLALASLSALPEECRAAFVLTQLDGYSYDEAAAIEGQPRGTIASRVFRAKKILLEQLSAHAGDAKRDISRFRTPPEGFTHG
jgi:RNA polymerase sigma-70 factor (ECF subfamily)